MAEGQTSNLQFAPDGVNVAKEQEDQSADMQFAPDGVNVAVQQDGVTDVQPTITVSATRDAVSQGPIEISEITGQFENVQVGERSNVLYSRVYGAGEGVSLHGTTQPTTVKTKDNLHFVIDSPSGVVQIGKCCILLRVNFSNSLVSRLLDEGDVSVKLHSSDTLLELHWSNWEQKKEGIRSRIKVEIQTSLEQSRDSFEHDVFSQLLNGRDNYDQLRTLVSMLYDMFGAMLHRITGGCIELWVMHDRREQLEEMRSNAAHVERLITRCLSKDPKHYTCSIKFLDDVTDRQAPAQFLTVGQVQRDPENIGRTPDDVISITKEDKTVKIHEEPVSREEIQTYVDKAVKRAIDESRTTGWQPEPGPQTMIQQHLTEQGGLMMIGKEGIRELMMHQEQPRPITLVRKQDLRGIIWQELAKRAEGDIVDKIARKGKQASRQIYDLTMSFYESVVDGAEQVLPDEMYIDIPVFKNSIYGVVYAFNTTLLSELKQMRVSDKDVLSEFEINELKVRNKTSIEMCSRAIAAHVGNGVLPPQFRQVTERLSKEPEESDTRVHEKEATLRPVDSETMRLRKERLLQQATQTEKDFLKQELDFYEINERSGSELPLGTRVEPKSKRALLQASIHRSGDEASARLEAAEETYGTVVSHAAEDEEHVIVHWDNPDESFLYHESGVRAVMRQFPRKIMREQQIGIGVFVEKSATWTFDDQAGPVGVGTVIRHDLETGLVQVKWHGGVPGWNSYRTGEDVETRKECFIDGEEESIEDYM